MSECVHCGATDDAEHGVVVGLVGDLNESVCTVCRSDELYKQTVLARREADVAAHKQITGATHETIADRLGIGKSTVDEYNQRIKTKVRKAATTTDELGQFV